MTDPATLEVCTHVLMSVFQDVILARFVICLD